MERKKDQWDVEGRQIDITQTNPTQCIIVMGRRWAERGEQGRTIRQCMC